MNLGLAVLLSLALVGLLFLVAAFVETRGGRLARREKLRHRAYALSLGVYCSSWTFYGAVGTAAREGWAYLPIYLGPIVLLLAAPRFLTRLGEAVVAEKATTVSDFISARFGHDPIVARLVTVIALVGTLPYIALQLRSIGNALAIVSSRPVETPAMAVAALLLALFAIRFGTRRFELSGRNEGLMFAIALDSLIKLAALAAVCALAFALIGTTPETTVAREMAALADRFNPRRLSPDIAVIALISTMAVIVLPRQFYMGLVQAQAATDLVRARLPLVAYLAAMAALALPIALAGLTVLNRAAPPDLYLLALPPATGAGWLLPVALLGGISAAAAMVIVESTALATMVSNDLVFPTVLRRGPAAVSAIGRRMLAVRAVSIAVIIALALAWALLLPASEPLASIGLIAFAAMAQFTPHVILATLGKNRDPLAARASLATGLLLWLWTLALPSILPPHWLALLRSGPFDPLNLFGIANASPLAHGVIWSLGANLVAYAAVSARDVPSRPLPRLLRVGRSVTDLRELADLTASFIGRERAEHEFPPAPRGTPVDRASAARAQQLIAGVVGAASARSLVASALAGGQMTLAEVTRLIDEGGQSLRFSRRLLAATFENIDAGISVVDAEMNLVAWNSRYLDLFDYPSGLVRVGAPVADLIRHNAQRGDFGPGDTEFHVAKRLEHMTRGLAHSFERRRKDGRVIKTVGGPMPGGGYVMSFTDITEDARVREELRRTLEGLETRVAERTHELSEANQRLAAADRKKTRFLAAASHDLLQPLHAARLFTAALEREATAPAQALVGRVERSIVAAEDLLRALLDISKLDAGGVVPRPEPIDLHDFLVDLVDGYLPVAAAAGLSLRLGAAPGRLLTDPGLLRSVMQNFLSNAVRYTTRGGIVVGARRRGAMLRIDVVDSGVGIPPDKLSAIFGEFTRLGEVEAEGLGLGLALVERIARLLGGRIELSSRPGRGSRFSLVLPALESAAKAAHHAVVLRQPSGPQAALTVLVVDNDRAIVDATVALLESLGHVALGAANLAEALAHPPVDTVIADFLLDTDEHGLDVIARLRERQPGLPALLVTAENGTAMRRRATQMGVDVLAKPVAPAAIEQFLARVSMREIEP